MFTRRFFLYSVAITLITYVLASTAIGAQRVHVEGLRGWQAPDHTRLVFDLSRYAKHKLIVLNNPDRLAIDIENGRLKNTSVLHSDMGSPVIGMRHGKHDISLRIVVDLDRKVHARSFILEPNENYGYRLVIDMYDLERSQANIEIAAASEQQDVNNSGHRDIIVTIDAGHGGEDPGAIGVSGIREKDLVLDYAKDLKKAIDAVPGIRAHMTRESDYFIGLRQRNAIAHKNTSDLFLSIHANSLPANSANRKVNGFMLFVLSDKGATSEMARWLAKSENRSDEIGGTGNLALQGRSRDIRKVLIDLSMTSVLNHSIFAGKEILKAVAKRAKLHSDDVEQAAFTVLKSPDIPALLIELGFMSNRKEEKLLQSSAYRQKLVQSIVRGIGNYFSMYPPHGTVFDQRSTHDNLYQVVSGDTLSEIAERYTVDIQELRRLNDIDGNRILIGQKLILHENKAASLPTTKKDKGPPFYVVKRGDTLSEIALRFDMPLNALRSLNDLTGNAIQSGQKIWLYRPTQ